MNNLVANCQICGDTILYKQDDNSFIASSEYEENFPGYCHSCLMEHCLSTNCLGCEIKKLNKKGVCYNAYMKKFYIEELNKQEGD